MLKLESKFVILKENCKNVYNFLSDLNNFNSVIKDYEINDWKANHEYCEFKIKDFGKIALKITESQPFEHIKYSTTNDSFINFNLKVLLKETPLRKAECKLFLEADIPIFLQPLVKNHLKNLIDVVTNTMENFDFKN